MTAGNAGAPESDGTDDIDRSDGTDGTHGSALTGGSDAPAGAGATNDPRARPERAPTAARESLGWRGWVLVAALVVSFVVIPWTIVFLPQAQGFLSSLGLGLRDAYLFLPMIPAVGLGVLAVWAAVASRRES